MIINEFYALDDIKESFAYDVHYIGYDENMRVDLIMKNMYDVSYIKYFKIMLYLNDITYIDELIEGYLLKRYDMDDVISYLRKKGFEL